MLTFNEFSGINNVQMQERLGEAALVRAENVDIGLSGEIARRGGFIGLSEQCHKNLHQARGFMLATVNGDLTAIHPSGARNIVAQSIGTDRVWYTDLPDGSTLFSNGLINGSTDGLAGHGWSIPAPHAYGAVSPISGRLHPGSYTYYVTHVRLSDGLEGPPTMAPPVQVDLGGVFLMGLPVLDGHKTNVYLSGHGGEGAYLAGSTATDALVFSGGNNTLTLPCRTMGLSAAPVGILGAFWRGRVLVAQGDTLWASMPHSHHIFDLRRDFKRFGASITMVQPVQDGIYVGTAQDLFFLSGQTFDQLTLGAKNHGPVVLGSGVRAPGNKVKLGDAAGSGEAMLCIAGGAIVAGFNGGQTYSITAGTYHATVQEVSAAFREVDGVPQYIAVPQ